MWLLSDSSNPLSNDRLKRVQGAQEQKDARKRLILSREMSGMRLNKAKEIQLGDWCVFRPNDGCDFMLGSVSGFQYIAGKSDKERQYTWDFAPVAPEHLSEDKKRGVNVMSSWYHIDSAMQIKRLDGLNCFYINIDNYVATFMDPTFEKTQSAKTMF